MRQGNLLGQALGLLLQHHGFIDEQAELLGVIIRNFFILHHQRVGNRLCLLLDLLLRGPIQ